jgi:hypothetical protein
MFSAKLGHAGIAQRFLGQAAHLQRAVLGARGAVGPAFHAHLAGVAAALAHQGLHQLALAVAGDTGHADDLAAAHLQVQGVDGGLAAVAGHAQAADVQPDRACAGEGCGWRREA